MAAAVRSCIHVALSAVLSILCHSWRFKYRRVEKPFCDLAVADLNVGIAQAVAAVAARITAGAASPGRKVYGRNSTKQGVQGGKSTIHQKGVGAATADRTAQSSRLTLILTIHYIGIYQQFDIMCRKHERFLWQRGGGGGW
jgi:hypothetical protein